MLFLTNVYSPIFEAISILMGITIIIFLIICIDMMASPAGEEDAKNENVKSNNSCEE
jgi:hypothetical protein